MLILGSGWNWGPNWRFAAGLPTCCQGSRLCYQGTRALSLVVLKGVPCCILPSSLSPGTGHGRDAGELGWEPLPLVWFQWREPGLGFLPVLSSSGSFPAWEVKLCPPCPSDSSAVPHLLSLPGLPMCCFCICQIPVLVFDRSQVT